MLPPGSGSAPGRHHPRIVREVVHDDGYPVELLAGLLALLLFHDSGLGRDDVLELLVVPFVEGPLLPFAVYAQVLLHIREDRLPSAVDEDRRLNT